MAIASSYKQAARSFERFTLKLALLVCLSVVHFWATFDGMRELIPDAGIDMDNWATLFTPKAAALMLVVATLTGMIIFALRVMFSEQVSRGMMVFWVLVYLFLEIVSIGLGFGFYWKILNSKDTTQLNVTAAQDLVDSKFRTISERIEGARAALQAATTYSQQTADIERTKGGTCGGAAKAGAGPRTRLRLSDAAQMQRWNDEVKGQLDSIGRNIENLQSRAKRIGVLIKSNKQDDAKAAMSEITSLNSRIASVSQDVDNYARSPQLVQIVRALNERAGQQQFVGTGEAPKGKGTPPAERFTCPDPTLSAHLSKAASALSSLPTVGQPPEIPVTIGSEATKTAFYRLLAWGSKGITTGDFSIAANAGIDAATNQFKGVDTLTRSDLLALVIAIAVDIGLLALAAYRPRDLTRSGLIRFFKQYYEDAEVNARLAFQMMEKVHIRSIWGHYIAIPETDKDVALTHLAKFFDVLHGRGEVRRPILARVLLFSNERIRQIYSDRESELAKYKRFSLYRFPGPAYAEMIMSAIKEIEDAGVVIESAPAIGGGGYGQPPLLGGGSSGWQPQITYEAARPSNSWAGENGAGTPASDWRSNGDPGSATARDHRGNGSAPAGKDETYGGRQPAGATASPLPTTIYEGATPPTAATGRHRIDPNSTEPPGAAQPAARSDEEATIMGAADAPPTTRRS